MFQNPPNNKCPVQSSLYDEKKQENINIIGLALRSPSSTKHMQHETHTIFSHLCKHYSLYFSSCWKAGEPSDPAEHSVRLHRTWSHISFIKYN
jgi:hypothetical protein